MATHNGRNTDSSAYPVFFIVFLALTAGVIRAETAPLSAQTIPSLVDRPVAAGESKPSDESPQIVGYGSFEEKRDTERLRMRTSSVLRQLFEIESDPGDVTHTYRPSNYMVDLYNRLENPDRNGLSPGESTTGDLHGIRNGYVPENIRSFHCQEATERQKSNSWRLSFNVSDLPVKSPILHAELAVYGDYCQHQTTARLANVTVFATMHQVNLPMKERVPLSWRSVYNGESVTHCWRTFNVTQAAMNWQLHRNARLRLRRFFLRSSGTPVSGLLQLSAKNDGNGPVLVVYYGKSVHMPNKSSRRGRRDATTAAKKEDPLLSDDHLECGRRVFEIKFDDVGWNRWVVSPHKYQAYRCAGSCTFPISSSVRTTHHATLESIFFFRKTERPKHTLLEGGACCVPTSHQPMTLLYLTKTGDTRVRIFKKMVATRCGCR